MYFPAAPCCVSLCICVFVVLCSGPNSHARPPPSLCVGNSQYSYSSAIVLSPNSMIRGCCLSVCFRAQDQCVRSDHPALGDKRAPYHPAVQPDQRPRRPTRELLDEERSGDRRHTERAEEHRVHVSPYLFCSSLTRAFNKAFLIVTQTINTKTNHPEMEIRAMLPSPLVKTVVGQLHPLQGIAIRAASELRAEQPVPVLHNTPIDISQTLPSQARMAT